ncbi:MAG: M28 family peptidase [Bacteroidota bacterium]
MKRMILQAVSRRSLILLLALIGIIACGGDPDRGGSDDHTGEAPAEARQVPSFNADSAYYFIDKQVAFGPRVPNTEAHQEAGKWLAQRLGGFADTLYTQETRVRAYDGTVLHIKNIIGAFQPETRRRILLCAHWDSRPYADYDPDPEKHYTAIDGANDGASGVGVLLEIARLISEYQPDIGIDIIFFDAEDYGAHQSTAGRNDDSWALGSQHWAKNPHRSDYMARYGILLDMVGASGATFLREGYSMLYAPQVVRKVWETGRQLGYENLFPERDGNHVTDDHYYLNTIRNIPTINIIHQNPDTRHGFFPEWHTTDDTMDVIDTYTLRAVGETVLHVIYDE